MKKLFILLAAIFSCSALAKPELYFVEPMVCTGKINNKPDFMHPSYTYASVKIVSFWSVRKKDCRLSPSSSTSEEYAETAEDLIVDKSLDIGGWFDGPVKVEGNKVTAPNGPWPGPMELEIIDRNLTEDGTRIDTLKGRYQYSRDSYYEMDCTATVVTSPSHIQNDTKNCD